MSVVFARRRGAALPTALLLLVALTAIAGGAFAMSRQSFRGGRNALVEQRAFAVAEAGLNRRIASWNQALNATPTAGGLPVGATITDSAYIANGDTAYRRITRLDPFLFWVQSQGVASIPNPELRASRDLGALVRIAYPSLNPQGAITSNGNVTVQGNAFNADGNDRVPYAGTSNGWDTTRCTGLRGTNTYALAVPPGATVQAKSGTLTGLAGSGGLSVLYTPVAGDSTTYIAFGTETMNTLIQNADLSYTPSNLPNQIGPSLDATGTACNTASQSNWGEPFGGAGAVVPCQTYFPIIYISGSANIQSNGRGQGILIVDGDLQINGTFDWVGLILVKDDVNKGNGSATITGAVMSRNINVQDGGSTYGGSQSIKYSKCAVESVLRGSAILIRVRERGWTQMY